MIISSKEIIINKLYPNQIRKQIERENIEQEILDAQELALMCFLGEDLDSMLFFMYEQSYWINLLEEHDKNN